MNTERYLEDYHAGEVVRAHGVTLSEADIIEFAFRYDPQPFHIDKPAATQSSYGGLIASGWQVAALAFRMLRGFGPWGMLEVYLLGMLVAIVNLTALASIAMGTASVCFVALMITTTAAGSHLDEDLIWSRLEASR